MCFLREQLKIRPGILPLKSFWIGLVHANFIRFNSRWLVFVGTLGLNFKYLANSAIAGHPESFAMFLSAHSFCIFWANESMSLDNIPRNFMTRLPTRRMRTFQDTVIGCYSCKSDPLGKILRTSRNPWQFWVIPRQWTMLLTPAKEHSLQNTSFLKFAIKKLCNLDNVAGMSDAISL